MYEEVNMLTDKKKQTFSGDNAAVNYQLAETNIQSVVSVYVGGVLKATPDDYTVVVATGVVTFTSAPPTGTGNVEITFDGAATTNRSNLLGYGQHSFQGTSGSRLILYGGWAQNGADNSITISGIPVDGSTTLEYFPVTNITFVGNGAPVTNIVQQYDRNIIYTTSGAFYTLREDVVVADTVITTYPIYPLHDKIGCSYLRQAQVIMNNPVTIHNNRVYEWVSTNVRDERNAVYISAKVQPILDALDLSTAVTFDNEIKGEYIIVCGKKAVVYNYHLGVWYVFDYSHTIYNFVLAGQALFFWHKKKQQ